MHERKGRQACCGPTPCLKRSQRPGVALPVVHCDILVERGSRLRQHVQSASPQGELLPVVMAVVRPKWDAFFGSVPVCVGSRASRKQAKLPRLCLQRSVVKQSGVPVPVTL